MQRINTLMACCCLLTECATLRLASPIEAGHLSRVDVINHISPEPSGAKFESHNGHWYGADSDAVITLFADRQVKVTEFGYAVQTYKGTYSVDASGAIHVSLRHYFNKWPIMYLYTDRRGALLNPANQDETYRLSGRAGTVKAAEWDSIWPFRQTK